MSSHPSELTPATPVTAFLVANRRPVAWVLLALALASFAGGVYLFARTFQSPAKPDDASDLSKLAEGRADEVLKLGNSEYVLGGLGAITLAAVLGAAGVIGLSALPKPTQAAREADARRGLVLFGGLAGLTLMAVGFVFAVEWYRFLSEWLDTKAPPPGTYRFVLALLVFVAGAGLAFLSAQPARLDERDDPLVRRLIFGMNLGLSTFLLLVILVVANIFVTLKVPNKLDTTATGLNSIALSESTGDYLATLTTPVTVYTPASEDGAVGADVHRLLDACRERNPQFFAVKYLSRTANREKLAELRTRYPAADFRDDGLLITAGRDEELHSYIKAEGLLTEPDSRSQGGPPRQEFVGESKLMRELLFLSDNKTKAVVYFTVGHGEIEVLQPEPAGPKAPRGRPANTLRTTLEKNAIEMKPLRFELGKPAVPADATILVIADPTTPFSADEAAAVKAYLKAPTASGKAGKLILIAGPTASPDRRSVVDIGLDGVLTDYGVTLSRKYILNQPTDRSTFLETIAIVDDITDQENPLWRQFGGSRRRAFVFPEAREVIVNPTAKPAGRAEPLMITRPDRATWLETEYPVNPARLFQQLVRDRELLVAKEAEPGGQRAVAAIVTEADKGKLAVFGSAITFLDEDNPQQPHGAELSASLLSATINWLREQPAVANIAAKTYGFYTPDRRLDLLRAGVVPVLMASLLTAALGVGVWIVRRK